MTEEEKETEAANENETEEKKVSEIYNTVQERDDLIKKEETLTWEYITIRFIEILSLSSLIFGSMWEGTEAISLTMPQFMMLYGAIGTVVSEIFARIINKKKQNL